MKTFDRAYAVATAEAVLGRLKAASPGPWIANRHGGVHGPREVVCIARQPVDSVFIAAVRDDVEVLAEAVLVLAYAERKAECARTAIDS